MFCGLGEGGESEELELKYSPTHSKKFQRDHEDIFTFENMPSLGQLHKVYIWHDDSQRSKTTWYLEYVQVDDIRTGKSFMFPCNKWLSSIKDDRQVARELICRNDVNQSGTLTSAREVLYEIEIVTSDKQNAGTSQNGWLIIEGSKRRSEKLLMKNSQQQKFFQR